MVMGRDSCSEGHGFESRCHILDQHFVTYICCKNCNNVCWKRPKINEKVAGVGPFFLKKIERSKTIWKMFGSKAGAGVFNKFNVAMLRVK